MTPQDSPSWGYSVGDVAVVVLNAGEESQAIVKVELEERFEVPLEDQSLIWIWRSKVIDGMGYVLVRENLIEAF